MKAQVSFEALISVSFLVVVLAAVVWSVDYKSEALSNSANGDFLQSACSQINGAAITAMEVSNATTRLSFDSPFNMSFTNSSGFSLSIGSYEYLCTSFTNSYSNSSGNVYFNKSVSIGISIFNNNSVLVVS